MATPQEIQRLLDQLNSTYRELGQTNPFANYDISNITDAVTEAQRLQAALRGAQQALRDASNTDLDGLVGAFKAVVGELSKSNTAINNTSKTFRGLTSLAQKLRDDQAGINKLSEKELVSIQAKIKSRQKELKDNEDALRIKINELQREEASQDLIDKYIDALNVVKAERREDDSLSKSLLETAKERLKQEKQISKAMGLSGAAVEGLKSALDKLGMGGLSRILGLDEAQQEMRKVAEEVTEGGTKTADFAGQMKILKAGAISVGKSFITNLKDPLAITKFIVEELVNALKGSDAATADMAKGLNMSYKEALATRRELTAMASATGNNFVNTKGMQESYVAINKSLGTNVMLSEDMLIQFTEMREMAGFTNEELQGIAAISITTGKSMNDVTGEFMAQAKISALQNGVLLNEKDLLKDINKVSAATTLSLGKNPKLIGEAVATAKSLGMELSQVDNIANSLLNFEESIANELEAELLLGKNINLEKARQAALNNDLATVAKEISDQIGSSAEFSKMNRIQQEALAKSVGMNREDLAKTLFVQEQLTGLTGDAAKEQEDILNKRIEEVGLAQAQKELAEGGVEGLREQVGIADKFNATMTKVRELFVMLADPILAVLDIFSPILGIVGEMVKGISQFVNFIGDSLPLMSALVAGATTYLYLKNKALVTEQASAAWTVIKTGAETTYNAVVSAGNLIKRKGLLSAIAEMAMRAYTSVATIPFIGPVLGAAAAAGALALGYQYYSKAGDVMSPADGKTRISTKEGGLYELSKNDDLVAAPGAVNKMKNSGSTTIVQQSPPVDNTESKRTNMLLEKIASQSPVFKIGTDEFFTATSKYSYQVQ